MKVLKKMIQGSEPWERARRGRITASDFNKVVCSNNVSVAKLVREPEEGEITSRAKKQFEVLEQLREGEKTTNLLNASGLKGLVEKGVVEVVEDRDGVRLSSQADKYMHRLLAERKGYSFAELGDRPPTDAMERGNVLEPEARKEFTRITGVDVEEVGMCIDDTLYNVVSCSPDGFVDSRGGGLETKCPLPQTHIGYLLAGTLPSDYKQQVHGCMAVTGAKYWWFMSYCPGLPPLLIKVQRNQYTENLRGVLKDFAESYILKIREFDELVEEWEVAA